MWTETGKRVREKGGRLQGSRAQGPEGRCWLTLTASGPSAGGRLGGGVNGGGGGVNGGTGVGEGTGDGIVEHGLGKPPGKGVLLAGVVRRNEPTPIWQAQLGTVSEARRVVRAEKPAARRIRETAKRKDHPESRQQGQLSLEKTNAVVALGWRRPVRRGGATDHRRYPHALGLETVVSPRARRLAGETGAPESCP